MSETIRIEALGAKGDGIGGGTFVPFSLPGEDVAIERAGQRGRLLSVVHPSPERVEPPCPHFGACGGCDLQHASPALYAAFKQGLVRDAFERADLDAPVAPLVPCPPATRRRAVFTAVRAGPRILLGFHQSRSHRIEDLKTCLVVVPEIERALPLLRRLAAALIDRKRPLRLTVLSTGPGLDIAIEDSARLTEALRRPAVSTAIEAGVARLTVAGETLIETARPALQVGRATVSPPPGAFVQAVAGAEEAMARLTLDHLEPAKRVVDLFCGVGTFTLRLAANAPAHGVESEAAALAALDLASRAALGLKPVTSERRDLFRRPVTSKELDRFDGLVFDPPRAGAEAQAHQIASSKVARVAAVSCNPTTLARDAAILVAGGYRLLSVTPIDQFLWSHHVEAVAVFER